MPLDLIYVSGSTLPSGEANAVHVAEMCDAFSGCGSRLALRARRGAGSGSLRDHYDLHHGFDVVFENKFTHPAWLLARALSSGRRRAPLYYGRRITPMARLGQLGYPVALELHFLPPARHLKRISAMLKGRRCLGLVVISEALKQEMQRQFPQLAGDAILVAHDGFRGDRITAPRPAVPGQPVRVVYSGSFLPGKGIDTVIATAKLQPEFEFHVLGGSAEQVRDRAATAPVNLYFHGHVPHGEIAARLPTFDIALAPYARAIEGARQKDDGPNLARWMSPLKLFEYMAAGLPMVVSDLPVLHELLDDGETALMVEPGDAAALAAAIQRLANDASLRLKLATAAQQKLGHCTWDHRAQRILEFLAARRAIVAAR